MIPFADDPVDAIDDLRSGKPTDDETQSMGRTLGKYQILSPLGAGGMAQVYLARDTDLGREVALKLLRHRFTVDRDQVQRFQQEARSASALNHPNIITIFELGHQEGLYFIASEFINGQTLRQLIATGPIAARQAIDIGIQAADALAKAHDAGIMHRDIKPANIMVRNDGLVKVLDFGVAKLVRRKADSDDNRDALEREQVETCAGWAVGTPRYMSPEQIRAQNVDGRSDIFSLGVVLYELVAGRRPFESGTLTELFGAVLSSDAPSVRRFASEAPPELERILGKALIRDRGQRYQTAVELRTFAGDAGGFQGALQLKHDGNKLTGDWFGAIGKARPVTGTWRNGYIELSFDAELGNPANPIIAPAIMAGWIDGDAGSGRMRLVDRSEGRWTAVRKPSLRYSTV